MKKRYLLFTGALALCLAFAGCGKKDKVQQEVLPTPTPVVTITPTPEVKDDLVEMEKTEKEKNAIGNKTASASKITILNDTDAEISAIYIRPNTSDMDDSEWGSELIKGSFTLKDGENAVYYFDGTAKDQNGNTINAYDIRIVYTNSDRTENYFRKLSLNEITQITLRMDESDWGYIPYATYLKKGSSTEYSTLEEVKERLGYYDQEEEIVEEVYDTSSPTPEPEEEPDPEGGSEGDDEIDQTIREAEGCIGSSLDTLIGTIGEPLGSDYEDEPESGETGYHYYDSFTVYTTVDENGNEIVAGVW